QGSVTRTDPKAGSRVTTNQTITIYVSTGPPVLDVPSIPANAPFMQARHMLKHSPGQFTVRRIDEYSDSVPKGDVISIDPSDQARKFSTITVTVSKGQEYVTVPDIPAGTSVDQARLQLEGLGLVPDFQPFGERANPVVYGVPAAGTRVHVGSTVTVIVF